VKTAEAIVRAELDAWRSLDTDAIMKHFARDAVWDDPSHGPLCGYNTIQQAVEGFIRRMTHAELQILNLVATETLVFTERVDRFVFGGTKVEAAIMGRFEVTSCKITAWRDYFDMSAARRNPSRHP
jgi:limonene-1,2-epoxide hydrolase